MRNTKFGTTKIGMHAKENAARKFMKNPNVNKMSKSICWTKHFNVIKIKLKF